MDFSTALNFAKLGGKITREDWNAPDQWVAKSPGFTLTADKVFSVPVKDQIGEGSGDFAPYLILCNTKGEFVPWVPTQGDLFSEEWTTVP